MIDVKTSTGTARFLGGSNFYKRLPCPPPCPPPEGTELFGFVQSVPRAPATASRMLLLEKVAPLTVETWILCADRISSIMVVSAQSS